MKLHRKTVFGGARHPIRRAAAIGLRRLAALLLAALLPGTLLLAPASFGPATAQMLLPGANNGVAVGAPPKAAGGTPDAAVVIHPIVVKPPTLDTILGHGLSRDGHSGSMEFDKSGDDVALAKLRFIGDKISAPQQTCSVDVSFPASVVVTPAGRPNGALRFDVPLEACPFTIDVLDGAVLVSRVDPSCDFAAADCRVTPGGLWGPTALDITPSKAADLVRQRAHIETIMRTNFRALLKKAGKDKNAVKAIARDQAAFSSQREMTCRDYDQEPVHGFCSTQITEARALELLAKFGLTDEPAERKHPSHAKKADEDATASELRMTPAPPPAASSGATAKGAH